ncbi:MAG TPA: lysophospholipid acyltransferase family protein [Granulicella sp.]
MRLATAIRSTCRGIHLVSLLIAAYVDGHIRRPKVGAEGAVWIHGWCKRIVAAMGMTYRVEGEPPASGAVVSNHLSYLDIMLYAATRPFIMVAKHTVRDWPLIGYLTSRAGTIYVQRSEDVAPGEKRQSHAEVNRWMAEAYATSLPVLFFPEGTTTDGSQILPFRRGLFHSVLNGGVPLRVSALRFYLPEGNEGATIGNDVCFVGYALLGPHLFRFLGLKGLTARIRFGGEVCEREDRFVLSQHARTAVMDLYESLPRETDAVSVDSADKPVYAGSLARVS